MTDTKQRRKGASVTGVLCISVSAPEAVDSVEFYELCWGLKKVGTREDGTQLLRGAGPEHHILELRNGPRGINRIEFAASSKDSVQEIYENALRRGAVALAAPGEFDRVELGWGFDLLDPDRRVLRVSCGVQQREFDAGAAIDSPTKISHVVLNTLDPEAIQQFYVDVLGFDVSDRLEDQMIFVRCGKAGHHQIAFFKNTHAALNHISFEMDTQKAVNKAIERLSAKGHEIRWGTGCHGIGRVQFTYFEDPNGFAIEYSWYTEGFDPASHVAQTWKRSPEIMDAWGTANTPTPNFRKTMAGEPDPGYQAEPEHGHSI